MKKTDLEKNKGLQINNKLNQSASPGRFGHDSRANTGRREQRKLDQAQGLVPFAVKLPGELVKQLQALAQAREVVPGVLVTELLQAALAEESKTPKK